MEDSRTLDRDRRTCQACGQHNHLTTLPLTPPEGSPWDVREHITICKDCRPTYDKPHPHAIPMAHLIQQGRTSNQGHPYLAAQIRMITNPLEPTSALTNLERELLAFIGKRGGARISLDSIRDAFPNDSERRLYQAFDHLQHHGYITVSPNNTHVLRLDFYARPPLQPDLTPTVDTPELTTAALMGETYTDPALTTLHHFMLRAGEENTKTQFRKLLREYLPDGAPVEASNGLFNLLETQRVLIKTPDGQRYTFTRRLDRYTNPELLADLQTLHQHPEKHRQFRPRSHLLREQARHYKEQAAQPKRKPPQRPKRKPQRPANTPAKAQAKPNTTSNNQN